MDRLYNSISLANWLLTRNFTCTELKDAKEREEFSTTLHYAR